MGDRDKTLLKAKKGVISSAGYVNTFTKLVDSKICDDNNIPREILKQSAGFVVSKQYQIILSICDIILLCTATINDQIIPIHDLYVSRCVI